MQHTKFYISCEMGVISVEKVLAHEATWEVSCGLDGRSSGQIGSCRTCAFVTRSRLCFVPMKAMYSAPSPSPSRHLQNHKMTSAQHLPMHSLELHAMQTLCGQFVSMAHHKFCSHLWWESGLDHSTRFKDTSPGGKPSSMAPKISVAFSSP